MSCGFRFLIDGVGGVLPSRLQLPPAAAPPPPARGLRGGLLKRKLHKFAFNNVAKFPKITHMANCNARFNIIRSSTHSLELLGVKKGPQTVSEMKQWPHALARLLFVEHPKADLMKARSQANLGMGLAMHSDYSGQLCGETGTRMAAQAMSHVGVPISGHDIVSWATCDISPVSRDVIKKSHQRLRPQHCFESVESHVDSRYAKKTSEHSDHLR